MSSKSLIKFVVAFGILAILLAFLGVNYVPRIFASSSTKEDLAVTTNLAVPVYLNQRYPRSIAPQLSYNGSDFFQRQAAALALPIGDTGSDFFQRQAAVFAKPIGSTGSEFLNHHPFDVTQKLNLDSSELIKNHPFPYYSISDWTER